MFVIKITETDTNKSKLFMTAFNVDRIPEVVKYDTIEEAEGDLKVIKKISKEDSLKLSFDIVEVFE